MSSTNRHGSRPSALLAAAAAGALAGVGVLVLFGSWATPGDGIMSVLVGFLVLGAGAALALALATTSESPHPGYRERL